MHPQLRSFLNPCDTPDRLHDWIRAHLRLDIPRRGLCPDHAAPFDYLCSAYFEPASDLVVWAPRGGGKTTLGAIATLLDLLHKPGVQVRILGGSLEQSEKMWAHLRPFLELHPRLIRKETTRRIELANGSICSILAQSERAVRGLRVQKVRCDEVELFDESIWNAAQLTTRSTRRGRGTIEALSTLHEPYGLMNQIVEKSTGTERRILKWCLLDVLEPCPPARSCDGCDLAPECGGKAKEKTSGFVSIDDAIGMKRRVSRETWESEMLCQKPSARNSVFPTFNESIHVRELSDDLGLVTLAIDFGFAAPFVALWISTNAGKTYVFDEYLQPKQTIAAHVAHLLAQGYPRPAIIACDPAGSAASDQTAISNVQFLRSAGFKVRLRASRIVEGLEKIRHALMPAAGQPTLFIHPRCKNLIDAMRKYRYAPTGSELPIKDGTHDHPIDALRYHYVNAPSLQPPPPPRRY